MILQGETDAILEADHYEKHMFDVAGIYHQEYTVTHKIHI